MSVVDGQRNVAPTRMLVLWCPDWPVVAAGVAAGVRANSPAAVFVANRVVACSAVARSNGVRRGMLRRQAQSQCPELTVFDGDEARDARLFEPVAAAVEELVVGVEVVRPGVVAVPVRGAAGYFGGEHRLAELLADHVSGKTGVECQIGVADGLFAGMLAARRGALVDEGETATFIAPMSIAELDQPGSDRAELVDLLRRLGFPTLGAFAELAEREVVSRFGSAGLSAYRLAKGLSERPPRRRRLPPELSVVESFDPPLERIDTAAFMAKAMAERFHSGLAARGLACTRLGIYATTEHGEKLVRVWRCADPLAPQGIADRVRWQFEGWLQEHQGKRPTAGVAHLRLEPEETVDGKSLQLGLWQANTTGQFAELADESAVATEQAGRALVRVQGLLGPEGVYTPVLDGGRGPGERVRLVPWGDKSATASPPEAPWPGQLPAPSPAKVFEHAPSAHVLDGAGAPLSVTERHRITGSPRRVSVNGENPGEVLGWAGPWPVDTQWWSTEGRMWKARMQVLLTDESSGHGIALLLVYVSQGCPSWTVEGVYD